MGDDFGNILVGDISRVGRTTRKVGDILSGEMVPSGPF